MTDLQQAINALTATQQQVRALRADTDLLIQELPYDSEAPVRARLQRLAPRLGSHLAALSAGWERTNQALQLAGRLPPPPPLAAATAAAPPPGAAPPPAETDDAEVAAASRWCGAVGRELEEALALHLMGPLHEDRAAVAERAAKRGRTGPAPGEGAEELDSVLARVRAVIAGDLSIHACSALGQVDVKSADASELRLLVPRVLCASVVFARRGGVDVVHVSLDAAHSAGTGDGWVATEHQVFRRLSALATRALAYFIKRAPAALVLRSLPNATPQSAALEDLLLWLSGYQGLFHTPCSATGRLVAMDPSAQVPMPPVFRPFKLSRPELQHLAQHPAEVRAYHMHAASASELGWCEEDAPRAAGQQLLLRDTADVG